MNDTIASLPVGSLLGSAVSYAGLAVKMVAYASFGTVVLQVVTFAMLASSITLQRFFTFLHHASIFSSISYMKGDEQGPLEPPSYYGFRSMAGERPLRIPSGSAELGAWHITLKEDITMPSDIVFLYLHGNLGHRAIKSRSGFYEHLLKANPNSELLVIDYRGFGDSTGYPSQRGLVKDGLAAWEYLTVERQVPHDRIVLLGSSLGSTVATLIANKLSIKAQRPRALILFAAPTNIPDAVGLHVLAQWLFYVPLLFVPVKMFVQEPFDALSVIASSETLALCPILYIHGDDDGIISHSSSETLFAAALKRRRSLLHRGRPRAEKQESSMLTETLPLDGYHQVVMKVRQDEKIGIMTVKGGAHDNLQEFSDIYRGIKHFLELMYPMDIV